MVDPLSEQQQKEAIGMEVLHTTEERFFIQAYDKNEWEKCLVLFTLQ